jgi:tetratricopeptide (TPR) repeat protein
LATIVAAGGSRTAQAAPAPTLQDPEAMDPRDLLMLGILYIQDNQPRQAIPLLQRAVDLYPENGETYMWLGVAQMFTEQYEESEESLMKALSRNPDLTDARNYLGFLRYKQGDYDGAVREYLTALRDPLYPPVSKARVRLNLGNVYLEMDNPEAAREHLAAGAAVVTARDELFAPMNTQLARALSALGRVQEAIAALQKVVDADDLNVEAHLELGLAYADLSQEPAARRHLQKVIDLAPGTQAADRALAALARLQ